MQFTNMIIKNDTIFDDVIIIDDVIPTSYQDHLAAAIGSDSFPWYWQKEVVSYDSSSIKIINDNWKPGYGFSHLFYCKPINHRSSYYDMILPMILTACDAVGKQNLIINRIRGGLLTRISDSISNKHHMPHADAPAEPKHTTMLYYPVDSDGDTYMFDKILDKEHKGSDKSITIKPKKGRAVFFNGLRYHASSNPTLNDFRVVINVNLY